MAGEAEQTLHATGDPVGNESKGDSGTESDVPAVFSSSNAAATKIADKTIPSMSDYWKKLMIIEADRKAYHSIG
jgi:hypothetical protein